MKALRDDHSETNKRFADMLYETSGQFQEESVKMATKLKESSELTMQMIGDSMVSIADKIKDDHLEIIEAYRVFNSALNSSQNENMQ
jgi:phosphate uptake regulator